MSAMLLLRTGQTVGMVELTRLAARRGDVVMTTAFLIHFGVSLRQVTNGNKSLQQKNTDITGISPTVDLSNRQFVFRLFSWLDTFS